MIIDALMVVAKPTPSTSGFDLSPLLPLLGVLIGGLVSAVTSFFLNVRSNQQQLARDKAAYELQRMRDEVAYRQQLIRDQQAYERQKEREQAGYERSLKDAKRERLRSAYKVILNAARIHEAVLNELQVVHEEETEETRDQRLGAALHQALSGLNEALVEISLDDVGADIKRFFIEMVNAYKSYTYGLDTNKQFHGTYTLDELNKDQNTVRAKGKELQALMQKHLKELES